MSEKNLTVTQRLLASATGATITALSMTPLDVIKTRLQAQEKQTHNQERLKGTFDALLKIPRKEGIAALWSGLPPTLAMVVPSTVLYFTSYDAIKFHLQHKQNLPLGYAVLISGAFARMLTVFVVAPLELIRTKMQTERMAYSELTSALGKMVKTYGARSLYIGLNSTLLRDVIFSCVYWSSYEGLKTSLFCDERPSFVFTLAAGASAGSTAAVITLPFDVVKTHRQMELRRQGVSKSESTIGMLSELYRKSGIRALFAGLTARLARTAPACAIMLSSYEAFKTYFLRKHDNCLN